MLTTQSLSPTTQICHLIMKAGIENTYMNGWGCSLSSNKTFFIKTGSRPHICWFQRQTITSLFGTFQSNVNVTNLTSSVWDMLTSFIIHYHYLTIIKYSLCAWISSFVYIFIYSSDIHKVTVKSQTLHGPCTKITNMNLAQSLSKMATNKQNKCYSHDMSVFRCKESRINIIDLFKKMNRLSKSPAVVDFKVVRVFGNFSTFKRWNPFPHLLNQALAVWFALIIAHWQRWYKQRLTCSSE